MYPEIPLHLSCSRCNGEDPNCPVCEASARHDEYNNLREELSDRDHDQSVFDSCCAELDRADQD